MKPETAIDILRDLWCFQKSERYSDKQIREALVLAIEDLKRTHGEWLTEPHSRIIHCSNCGAEENMNKIHVAKWCYSCGADMRKEGGKNE